MSKFISVSLPTRKRVSMLKESIESLVSNCNNYDDIEILLALDEDDSDTISFVKTLSYPISIKIIITQRVGYYNELCKISTGTPVFLWNDDALMISKYWDKIVRTIYDSEKNKTVGLSDFSR